MGIRDTLRMGVTICTLAAASISAKSAYALPFEGEGEECTTWVRYPIVHTVKKGEDLWDIAQQYFGRVKGKYDGKKIHHPTDIALANGIKTSDYKIHPGQHLIIPGKYNGKSYCE